MSSRNEDAGSDRLDGAVDGNGENVAGLMDDVWGEDPQPVPSIGDYLTKQRQLRGISRDQLCTMTRIPLRSLERLESGAFDTLDDGFVRGFVRTVASALGLDPDDTLARMTQEPDAAVERANRVASIGMVRAGILAAGVVLVLISVGLVRIAVQYLPGQDVSSDIVMRADPVRQLAEARRGSDSGPGSARSDSLASRVVSTDDLVLRVTPRTIEDSSPAQSDVETIPRQAASADDASHVDSRAVAR